MPVLSQVTAPPVEAYGTAVWIVSGLVVLIGLGLLGFQDLCRLSMTRIWAISGVCFAESIRRRILLVTPLAILGVIIVTQIQNPLDEQDAVRQTLKFCVFAAGLVLVLTTIILACTSIPKEIETKVIFTIVTKPTSRLEIVFGKIVGFARVSATLLVIMGLFTWGYVEFRAWRLEGFISDRLSSGVTIPPTDRAQLTHYKSAGLLGARSLESPQSVAIYALDPAHTGTDRWIFGSENQQCLVRFNLDPAQQYAAMRFGIYISAQIKWEKYQDVQRSDEPASGSSGPFSPTLPNGHPPFVNVALHPPAANIELIDDGMVGLVQSQSLYVAPLPKDVNLKNATTANAIYLSEDGTRATTITVWMPPPWTQDLQKHPYFYARVAGLTEGYRFAVDAAHPVIMTIRSPDKGIVELGSQKDDINITPDVDADKQPIIVYRGQTALFGQQITGGDIADEAKFPLAIYTFRHARTQAVDKGMVSMELTSPIDRVSAKVSEQDDPTRVDVTVRDLDDPTHQSTQSLLVENRRTSFFKVPADDVASGNFEVVLRDRTDGHYLGLLDDSLQLVTDRQAFALNLFKSLVVLWMLSVLVVTISIFSSTFVSWPIAVVLTTVILLGHWVVLTVGEPNSVALGRAIVRDMFPDANGGGSQVIDTSIEHLTTWVNALADVLPDVSHFDATGELERGQIVGLSTIGAGAIVLAKFGVPLAVMAYVLMKKKEVAP